MKTLIKPTRLILTLFSLAVLISCKKDDDTAAVNLNASDLTVTIIENPEDGQILGNIAVSQLEGTNFELVSSNPVGAFSVNATTGEVTVGDPAGFDFETQPSANATINITNGGSQSFANVTVTIQDADDLLTLLTTSREAYRNETTGWIEVTAAEYFLLEERMQNVFIAGVSEELYQTGGTVFQTAGDLTVTNDINVPMQPNTYFFAFRYYAIADNSNQVRPKVSENTVTSGYIGRGPLPEHDSGDRFFVKKGDNQRVSNTSYLGLYSPNSMGWLSNTQSEMYYRFGNGSTLTNGVGGVQVLIQGLTTTEKQWD
jgi:hypothetical protein